MTTTPNSPETPDVPDNSNQAPAAVQPPMPEDREDPLTAERMQEIADELRQQLEGQMTRKWDLLERPIILAGMFAREKRNPIDAQSHDFESMQDAFYGVRTADMLAPSVEFHADLTAAGHISEETKFEFGNDAYVWAVADRTAPETDLGLNWKAIYGEDYERPPLDPEARKAKAFVLETQSSSFLFVMNYDYGRWSELHVRQFWPDINEELAGEGYLLNLDSVKGRTDLTIVDLVKYSTRACGYSDMLPGVDFPERPSLAGILKDSLFGGEDDAGIALRYGDFRDRGYIFSVKVEREGRPKLEKVVYTDIGRIRYVAANLSSAIYVLANPDD